MNITDKRNDKVELDFYALDAGMVYVVCLYSGEQFDEDECYGDRFTPVKATLVVE